MKNFNYYIPTRILFGAGQLNELHKQQLPGKKALVVISAGKSVRKYGYLDRLLAQLNLAGVSYAIYDKVQANPTKDGVMEAAALARQEKCDFVIGLGGGSAMDSAKATAIMVANDGDLWDYFNGGSAKSMPIPNKALPMIAITTSAGTGTEADPWMVITNTELCEKIGFGCDDTYPVIAVVDPELMVSVPPLYTAYQGFDALFHSTEGYLNVIGTPISDIYALKAISLVSKSLAAAVADGSNIEARADVALANTMSGIVESTSCCTSEHSLEHAISGLFPDVPHGAGLLMVCEAYYTFFAKCGACDERMMDMARAMGVSNPTSPMDFVDALVALRVACGVDNIKMSDYGITREDLPKILEFSRLVGKGMYDGDCYQLSDADVMWILEASYQ